MSRDGKPLDLPGLYWDETRRRYFPLSSRPKRKPEREEDRELTAPRKDETHARRLAKLPASSSCIKAIRSGNGSFVERSRLAHELVGRALPTSHKELDPPIRPLSWHSSKITAFHTTMLDGTLNVIAGDSSGIMHCARVEPRPHSDSEYTNSPRESDAFNDNARVFTSYHLGAGAPVSHVARSGPTAVAVSSTTNACQLCIRDLKAPDDGGVFFPRLNVSGDVWAASLLDKTLALGMSHKLVFVNDVGSVASAKRHTTFPMKSDVLSILQHPNTLIAGFRSGEVRLFDVRAPERSATGTEILGGRFTGATHLNDSNSVKTRKERPRKAHAAITHLRGVRAWEMLVCTSAGELEMFDLRFCTGNRTQPTMIFTGHVNEYLLDLGLTIDPSASFLFAAGQDNRIRGWSLRTGELLGGNATGRGTGALLGGERLRTPVRALQATENPLRLWVTQDDEVRVWQLGS
ncbi:hypothetical protein M0805_008593 [Coniferiporia weirii]|nr:hypothetical protein M0805_008593 [Coniferiporia weirii]